MIGDAWVYAVLALTSTINIIVPISGSATVTPFLAILTDPHTAIGLASFYFLLGAPVRIFLFRKDIQWPEVRALILPSTIMAAIGAAALIAVPALWLLAIVFVSTVYFLYRRIRPSKKKESRLGNYLVGLLSGFLQGTGLAGSDLRNSYLYSKQLTIAQVHGTTAIVGASNFLIATIVRLQTDQLTLPDLVPLLYIFPFIVGGILLGRHLLYRLSKKTADNIVLVTMIVIVVFLGLKIVQML